MVFTDLSMCRGRSDAMGSCGLSCYLLTQSHLKEVRFGDLGKSLDNMTSEILRQPFDLMSFENLCFAVNGYV